MRTLVGMLACIGAGAMSLALADPSNPAQPEPAAVPSSASSATAPAVAPAVPATAAPASQAAPAVDPDEKRLIAMGYRAKLRNGVKIFCRRDDEIGTRLGHVEHCGTVAELKASVAATRDDADEMRRQALKVNPQGR